MMYSGYSNKLPSIKCFFILLFILFTTSGLQAQNDPQIDYQGGIKYVQKNYNSILKDFNNDKIVYDSIRPTLKVLISYRDSLFSINSGLKKEGNDINEKIAALGPLPADGQPAESEFVAKKRKELNANLNKKEGMVSSANLLLSDLDDLINKLSNQKTSNFLSGITSRTVSPFNKQLWSDASMEWKELKTTFKDALVKYWESFWDEDKKRMNILILLVSFILAAFFLYIPHSKQWQRIKNEFKIVSTDPLIQKRLNFIVQPLLSSLMALFTSYIVFWGFNETGAISVAAKPIFISIIYWFSSLVFIWNFAKKIFIPGGRLTSILAISEGSEKSSRLLFFGMFLIFSVNKINVSWFKIGIDGSQLVTAESIVNTSIFTVLLYLFFMKRRWEPVVSDSTDLSAVAITKLNKSNSAKYELTLYIAKGLAIVIIGALLLEYVRLANFIYHRIVLLAWYVISFISIRTLGRWLISKLSKRSDENLNEGVKGSSKLNFWMDTIWDITLIILGIPSFLIVIGIDWIDVKNWIDFFSTGLKIGGITISLKDIVNGIVTFVMIIIVFRWTATKVNKRLVEYEGIDSGIRNSIITMINYLGVIVAILAAIPAFGFSLSKISIVAGALSVGIGFGLQSIARDFVSGLILLFERPFKIGDWVVVQSGEGYVREIKLRSTIIQTFDMACIVVPNSELVSSSVQNIFYKGKSGRIIIKIGVNYNSDPEQVENILIECAKEHKAVLLSPAPYVYWEDFGDNAMQFQLRAYIKNMDSGLSVKNTIRFYINRRFKEEGINIPYPQRDLHIIDGSLPIAKEVEQEANESPEKVKVSLNKAKVSPVRAKASSAKTKVSSVKAKKAPVKAKKAPVKKAEPKTKVEKTNSKKESSSSKSDS